MKTVARVFYVVGFGIAVGLLIWALVSTLVGDPGFTFPSALLLWLATGLPLVLFGALLHAFGQRRSSMRMPPASLTGHGIRSADPSHSLTT